MRRPTASASSATLSTWPRRSGSRSCSACSRASPAWRETDVRCAVAFWSYRRWSASLSASAGSAGLGRHQRDAAGRPDLEAAAVLQERGARLRQQLVDQLLVAVEQDAELVAAQPVRLPWPHREVQVAAQLRQQRVAGGMAEAVVVALEAVEVEEHQRVRAARRWRGAARAPGRASGGGGCRAR